MKRLLFGALAALALSGVAAAPAQAGDRFYDGYGRYDRYDRYYDRYDRCDPYFDRGYARSSRYYDPYLDGRRGGYYSRGYVRDPFFRPRRRSRVRIGIGFGIRL